MNNSDQEKQDQRADSGMEDSTTMTIEFLRARLLSERSVSRSARQRADELAERVSELEEQLRYVSIQRMKAEKATADVLAILEGNGISDISETFDSSSDQDTPSESKVGNRSAKEENSVNSKVRNNESEELSGSDFDFSPAPGRSLSWKGRKDSPRSFEKYKDPSLRRRHSFSPSGSIPKRYPGKSCRQIRHKESRYVVEAFKASPAKADSLEDEPATTSERFPNSSDVEQNGGSDGLGYNVREGDGEMEKALERQAQLIGQYEEMEKAQREWEEKYRENNSSTPDSCDHGNRSDITEERYEMKVSAAHPDPATAIASETNAVSSEVEDLSKIQPDGILPSSHVDAERGSNSTAVFKSSTQDFAFPMANGKQHQDSPNNHVPSHVPHHDSPKYPAPLNVPHQYPASSNASYHDSVLNGSHGALRSQSVPDVPSNVNTSPNYIEPPPVLHQHPAYSNVSHHDSDLNGSHDASRSQSAVGVPSNVNSSPNYPAPPHLPEQYPAYSNVSHYDSDLNGSSDALRSQSGLGVPSNVNTSPNYPAPHVPHQYPAYSNGPHHDSVLNVSHDDLRSQSVPGVPSNVNTSPNYPEQPHVPHQYPAYPNVLHHDSNLNVSHDALWSQSVVGVPSNVNASPNYPAPQRAPHQYPAYSNGPHHDSVLNGSHDALKGQSVPGVPSNITTSSSKEKAYGNQNELYAMVPHRASDGFGNVLEALKEAKQSLQQRIDKLPFVAASVGKSFEASVPSIIPRDKLQISVGCAGLFRIPTDFSAEPRPRADILNLSSRLSLGNYYPHGGVTAAASSQFISSPYLESGSNMSTEDQFLANQYVSRIPTQKPYFDPYLDTGLPSSSRYTYPSYPINTSYPDLMPRMPTGDAFLTSLPGRISGTPSSNQFPFVDDKNIKPNMYR